jgi:hypothetical protein
MSMMARFVAVAPDRLDAIRKSPDLVEDLFAPDIPLKPSPLPAELQERVRQQAPQMLASTLERLQPEMRAQVMQRLGIGASDASAADIGESILKRMRAQAASLRQPAQQDSGHAAEGISLDKAWHGLHYLLSGAAEPAPGPLGQAVFGGTEIGEDLGYGPARCFTVTEVSAIAQAFQAPDLEAAMHGRFDPAKMTSLGIYPGGWDTNGDAWLIDAFHTLRDFYTEASEAGQAVVTLIE